MKRWVIALSVVLAFFVLVPSGAMAAMKLVVGQGVEPVALDPADVTDNPSEEVCHHIYEGLIGFNENMNIIPKLATDWSVSEDGKTWTFHLKKGVKFHSGADFNAEAVKKSFDRILAGGLKRSSLYKPVIGEVKVVDDYTVQFVLPESFGPFLHTLCHTAGLIVDPTLIDAKADVRRKPSGTGPFKFKEWAVGDQIKLAAFDGYHGGKPKLDELIFKVVPEDASRTMMLETGELDVAERLSPFDIERLKANKDLVVEIAPSLRVIYIGMNCQKGITKDVLVRRAFNHAVDKKAICDNILKGMGVPTDTPMSPKTNGYAEVTGYPYDPQKAKELLSQAGWKDTDGDGILEKDGQKLSVNLMTPHGRYLMDYKVTEAVQAYLKEIGVDAKLVTMEWGTYIATLSKPLEENNVDMYLLGWSPSTGDADWALRPLFHSANWSPNDNYSFYKNPKVDELIEAGMRTVDTEKRKEIYKEAQELIVEDAPWVTLYWMNNVTGYWNYVKGLKIIPLEMTFAHQAYVER